MASEPVKPFRIPINTGTLSPMLTDGVKVPFDSIELTPEMLAPMLLELYSDGTSILVRKRRNTSGWNDVQIQEPVTAVGGLEGLHTGTNEVQQTIWESVTDNTTDLTPDSGINIIKVACTSTAVGDIAVDITKATAGVAPRLLKVFLPMNLDDTSGGAGASIKSDDATPLIFAQCVIGDSWTAGTSLVGNMATTAAGKKWVLTGGGLGNAQSYTVWAWIYC